MNKNNNEKEQYRQIWLNRHNLIFLESSQIRILSIDRLSSMPYTHISKCTRARRCMYTNWFRGYLYTQRKNVYKARTNLLGSFCVLWYLQQNKANRVGGYWTEITIIWIPIHVPINSYEWNTRYPHDIVKAAESDINMLIWLYKIHVVRIFLLNSTLRTKHILLDVILIYIYTWNNILISLFL